MNGNPEDELLQEIRHSLDRVCRAADPAATAAAVLPRIHGHSPAELLDRRRARVLRNLSGVAAVLLAGLWLTTVVLDRTGAEAAPMETLVGVPDLVIEGGDELPQYSRENDLVAAVFLGEVVR